MSHAGGIGIEIAGHLRRRRPATATSARPGLDTPIWGQLGRFREIPVRVG